MSLVPMRVNEKVLNTSSMRGGVRCWWCGAVTCLPVVVGPTLPVSLAVAELLKAWGTDGCS